MELRMLLRRWISLLAVVGVLLHAGALVRHNAAMAGAHLQHQALVADLQVICHSGGPGAAEPADIPYVPRPFDAEKGCPLCSGVASAFALIGPAPVFSGVELCSKAFEPPVFVAAVPVAPTRLLPPARGPPDMA
jgi:hypothetical protein